MPTREDIKISKKTNQNSFWIHANIPI